MSLAFFFFFCLDFFFNFYFKYYPLSWFLFWKPSTPYPITPHPLLTNPSTPASWPCFSPTLRHRAFTGPRASPPIDDWLGHPLLHMQLEPWVQTCVLFGWWFSPWELGGCWLVHIVPPMRLQTHSARLVLSLALSLGNLCSVQWMAVRIHFCICQALRKQLCKAPVSKHLVGSTKVSGFGDCIWDGSPDGAVSGWSFLHSLLHTLSL